MADEESFKVTDRRGRSGEATERQSAVPPLGIEGAPSATTGADHGQGAGPDLSSLFMMFASSVLIHLGEASDPMAGRAELDLPQAREGIDVLLLLREKTKGNRTQDESRLLDQILYDLQMRFVRASQRPTRP